MALKLELTKIPPTNRAHALDVAFALEEILQAVDSGETRTVPRLQKKQPVNKIVEERMKKAADDERKKVDERKKLEERKKMLKEQLDKLKVDKEKKTKQEEEKKKVKDQKIEEKRKIKHEKLKEDLDKLKMEFAEKREKK